MRVAITGGNGFVGRHLTQRLLGEGRVVVLVTRDVELQEPSPLAEHNVEFAPIGLDDPYALAAAFDGCEAVIHLAGINREIGEQTYESVHIVGTANVVKAAREAGVRKIVLLSFLRARPFCGSGYHESKWKAEEIIRHSGLDYSILRAGVIYGLGDHLLDHISHAVHTFPFFLGVGLEPRPLRPLAIDDLTKIMSASIAGRLSRETVTVMGPQTLSLIDVVSRIASATGNRALFISMPVWVHYLLALFFECTMRVPLISRAQVRILAEGLSRGLPDANRLPDDLEPRTEFTQDQIRKGLPAPGPFSRRDCLCRAIMHR